MAPRITPFNDFIPFIPDYNLSMDDEHTNHESTDESTESTNDQPIDSTNDQPTEAQAINTSEEPTVVRVRRIKRIKKWFINVCIGLFKRRHN